MAIEKRKFAVALLLSLMIALSLVSFSLFTGVALSMGITGPFGGFCVEANDLSGNDFSMVSAQGTTTAQGQQPLLRAEIGDAEVSNLKLYRDLPVPERLTSHDISGARLIVEAQSEFERGDDPLQVGDAEIFFSYMETNYVELENAEVYDSDGTENVRYDGEFEDEEFAFEADSAFLDRVRARAHAMSVDQINMQNPSIRMELLGAGRVMECYSTPGVSFYDSPDANNDGEWIDRVQFNRLDHESGKSAYGYEDNTFRGTDVAPGGEYELITTVGRDDAISTSEQHGTAWIDWDQNEAVNTSEVYELGDCDDDECTLARVIDVPEDAEDGQALLRLIHQANEPTTAFYDDLEHGGEILDYSVDYGVANNQRYDPVSADDTDIYVDRVRFGNTDRFDGISDFSGQTDEETEYDGYQDRTDEIAHVAPSEEVPLGVNIRGEGDAYVSVWIDWNRNDFLEDWERYDLGNCAAGCNLADRIDVPTFADSGPTLMRVAVSTEGYVDEPRDDIGDGQVVDYTVNINDAYADAEEYDFVSAENRNAWISGVEVGGLNDVDRRETVVDFNWAYPECRDQGITALDDYFYPDGSIDSDDDAFHEDDGGGVDGYTPGGECFLRTDADDYVAIFSDPDASDGEQSEALDRYPERGDVIEYRHYWHNDGNDYGDFYFGRQDADNYYMVRADDTNDPGIELLKSEGGTEISLDSANPDMPASEFHYFEVDWGMGYSDGGHIEVTFTNAESGDTTTLRAYDDTFDDGGIGFGKANDGFQSYAHLWDRVTVNGMTRADTFDRVELFGLPGYEDRTYERGDVVRGEEYEMTVTAEGADDEEVYATVFFDWNRNQFLGPDAASAFRFLDDFEYGDPSEVDRPPFEIVENFADTDDPEYLPLEVEDFGRPSPYERDVVDFNWNLETSVDQCDADASQEELLDRYFPNDEIDGDEADQWDIRSGDGGDEPDVGECVLFTEGSDWDGDDSVIFSLPDGENDVALDYYPERGETITYREAHFRGTDLMFIFGAQNTDEFYGVYVEAWADDDGDYTVPVEIRKYTGGIGGSYTTLASDSFTMNDEEWLDRNDDAVWEWEVDWGDVGFGNDEDDIEATLYRPDGTEAVTVEGTDGDYDGGGIGHWSDRGTHTSWGNTYSNAGYFIDAGVEGDGCSIDADAYRGDTADFSAQQDTVAFGSDCALQGDVSDSAMISLSGLDEYPERGERIRYRYLSETGSDAAFLFGAQTTEDTYAVRKDTNNDELRIERWESGGALTVDSESVDFDIGAWHEVLVDWGGPTASQTITVAVVDEDGNVLGTVEGDDGRYDSGGVGYGVAEDSNGAAYWDEIEMEEPRLVERFEYEDEETVESFGSDDQPFETPVADFNWAGCDVSEVDDRYFLGGGDGGDFDLRAGDGDDVPDIPDDDCTLFFEGSDWSGDESWILSMPGAGDTNQDTEINYYPERGDTITYREAHFRGTDLMFIFGAESETDFYGVYIEAWADDDGEYTVPVELREYSGGIGGTYDTLESDTFVMDDQEWIERNEDQIWEWKVEWDSDDTADNEIVATLSGPDGGERVTLSGFSSAYDDGGVGHWSDRGTHSYIGTTQSNAGYHIDVEAEGVGCVLSDNNYRNEVDLFESQSDVTYDDNDCALTRLPDEGYGFMYSLPDDGLSNYPEQGDRIRYMFRADDDGHSSFAFGVQDEERDNGYRARINPSSDDIALEKYVDGGVNRMDSETGVSMETGEWYEVRIDWGTEITLSVHEPDTGYRLGEANAVDRDYIDGGIGFEGGTADQQYWDDVRIENRFGVCSLDEYSGDTDEFTARQFRDDDNTCQLSSDSDEALMATEDPDHGPELGDNIRFDYWIENPDITSKFLFGVQNIGEGVESYYALNVTDRPNGFALEKWDSGEKVLEDTANITGDFIGEGGDDGETIDATLYDLGEPADYPRHDVNIQWGGIQPGNDSVTDDEISARIFQYDDTQWSGDWFPVNVTINESDHFSEPYTDGGIGFVKEDEEGDRVYWDNIRVDNCKTYGYRGDRESIYAQPNVVSTGRCALEAGPSATDDTIFTAGQRNPREGVDEFAERGDTLRFDYRFERPVDDEDPPIGQFFFGPNPTRAGDTYGVQLNPYGDEDQFVLFRCDCGEIERTVSDDIELRPDVWYTVEIAWGREGEDDDEIVARVFGPEGQIADISMDDDTYDDGDVGFRKVDGEGSRVWWDDVRVFDGESRFDLGSCEIEDDTCEIDGDIAVPTEAQGGSVLTRTILSEDGYALTPYDDTGDGEVVDHTLNVDTSLEPTPEEAFGVSITDTNSPIDEGESLDVTAEVENTKNETETQTLTLEADDVVRDSADVTLDPGEATNTTLSWDTEVGEAGSYTAVVSTDDDSDTRAVEVGGVNEYPSSEGDASFEWVENVEVANVTDSTTKLDDGSGQGDPDGYQDRTFESAEMDQGQEYEVTVTAAADTEGDSQYASVWFDWDADYDLDARYDVGVCDATTAVDDYYTCEVSTTVDVPVDAEPTDTRMRVIQRFDEYPEGPYQDDFFGQTVDYTADVQNVDFDPATYEVAITGTNSPAVEGEAIEVTAEIDNVGQEPGNQDVSLEVPDGTVRDAAEVVLDGGESTTETFEWSTSDGDTGTYDAYVRSDDDEDSETVTVEESATFDVDIIQYDDEVVEGEELDVTATVENTGEVEGTQDLELYFDLNVVDSDEVTLEPGEDADVTLTASTEEGDAGDYTATFESEDDEDSREVTVLEAAYFDVDITDTNSPVEAGEEMTFDVQLTNTGEDTGTGDVTLWMDPEQDGSYAVNDTEEDVTLAGGEATVVTLGWSTTSDDVGDADALVDAVESDSGDIWGEDETTVTVEESSFFDVTIDDTNEPVLEGEDTLVVDTLIENTGGEGDTQDITLEIDGVQEDLETDVSVPAGGDESVTLQYATEFGDYPEVTATVLSDNNDDSTPVEVLEERLIEDFGEPESYSRNVVDFSWAYPSCPDVGVTELDNYFFPDGNIGASDDLFHEDDASGADETPPSGECVLRQDSDSSLSIYSVLGEQDANLEHYPEPGESINVWHYVHRADIRFVPIKFGVQDEDNYYQVEMEFEDGGTFGTDYYYLRLQRVEGGNVVEETETQLNYDDDEYTRRTFHRFEVDWHDDFDGWINAYLHNQDTGETFSAGWMEDSTYMDGGIGFEKEGSGVNSRANLWDTVEADGFGCVFDDSAYTGDLRSFDTQDEIVSPEGTTSCALEGFTDSSEIFSFQGWGLSDYPERGDRIRYWTRNSDEFRFGAQDENNYYGVWLSPVLDEVRLVESGTEIGSEAYNFQDGEWYEVLIDWGATSNDDITVEVYDSGGTLVADFTVSDTTYNDGGIGFSKDTSDSDAYWDDIRVETSR